MHRRLTACEDNTFALIAENFVYYRVKIHFLIGQEISITPFTSEGAVSKSDENMRDAAVKTLPLNRVEYFHNRILYYEITSLIVTSH